MIETREMSGIAGLLLVRHRVHRDERGLFVESYNARDWTGAGIGAAFVQDNESRSKRGVLRGLHFQRRHPQGKLMRVVSGDIFDVVVDLRAGSPSFGRWAGMALSGEGGEQLYLPPGLAHGFLVLSETATVAYKCTDYYHPEDEDGIRWDDPTLGIVWPDLGMEPILSAKDLALAAFDPHGSYFTADGSPS